MSIRKGVWDFYILGWSTNVLEEKINKIKKERSYFEFFSQNKADQDYFEKEFEKKKKTEEEDYHPTTRLI